MRRPNRSPPFVAEVIIAAQRVRYTKRMPFILHHFTLGHSRPARVKVSFPMADPNTTVQRVSIENSRKVSLLHRGRLAESQRADRWRYRPRLSIANTEIASRDPGKTDKSQAQGFNNGANKLVLDSGCNSRGCVQRGVRARYGEWRR